MTEALFPSDAHPRPGCERPRVRGSGAKQLHKLSHICLLQARRLVAHCKDSLGFPGGQDPTEILFELCQQQRQPLFPAATVAVLLSAPFITVTLLPPAFAT